MIPEGKAHIIVGLEPLETLRLLQKYGNPEVLCITNTRAVYPVDVMANNLEYPDYDKVKETIKGLSKTLSSSIAHALFLFHKHICTITLDFI